MKKFIFLLVIILLCIFFLQLKVTTRQCINYQCHASPIPLYLKLLDFVDRHYNYSNLVRSILKGAKDQDKRVIKILEWTKYNLKKTPEGLPIVDDHVWHIIIRGYGTDDQFQDVFTTLCNYAGLNGFFADLRGPNNSRKRPFSFIKIGHTWTVIDAYNGVFFRNNKGDFASLEELINGRYQPQGIEEGNPIGYQDYFRNLTSIDCDSWYTKRSAIQSPFHRLIFWFKHKK
jgi:hypothetical protein